MTLVCHTLDASPLMMPFVQQMSGAIEERLRCFATRRERALLDAFTKAATSAPPGHRRQRADDHHQPAGIAAARRRRARDPVGVRGRRDRRTATDPRWAARQPGVEINATFDSLVDGGEVLGRSASSTQCCLDGLDAAVGAAPRRLAGRLGELSVAAAAAGCTRSTRAAGSHEPILLIGEAGSGKLHLARAVHQLAGRATTLSVFDAALAQVDGAGVWLRRVKQKFDARDARAAPPRGARPTHRACCPACSKDSRTDRATAPRSSGCTPATIPTTTSRPRDRTSTASACIESSCRVARAQRRHPDLVKAIATGLGTRTSPCRATHCRR